MSILTFEEGLAKLKGKDRKKLENNTYLVKVDDATLGVKLHDTIVVYIFESGVYQLDTGGWKSVTTKDRMNKYSPIRVYSENGIWHANDGIYGDGVRADSDGKILTPQRGVKEVESKKRELDRMVRKYIKGFGAHVVRYGLDLGQDKEKESPWKVVELVVKPLAPSAGDCWACYFGLSSEDPLREPLGVSHLLGHMAEEYYVPSLLWKAILVKGYGSPAHIWHHIGEEAASGSFSYLDKQVLTPYFRKRKAALLELMED